MDAVELFESVLKHVEESYTDYNFFCERDIVWTLQRGIWERIRKLQLPFRVFHEHPFDQGKGRPAMDLAILDLSSKYPIKVALELKYEPDHKRQGKDIRPDKYVEGKVREATFWTAQTNGGSVQEGISRTNKLIDTGKVEVAYAILVDEGGFHHATRQPFSDCEWIQWKPKDTSLSPWVHWFKKSK